MGQRLQGRARTTAAGRRALHQSQARRAQLAQRDAVHPQTVAPWKPRACVQEAPWGRSRATRRACHWRQPPAAWPVGDTRGGPGRTASPPCKPPCLPCPEPLCSAVCRGRGSAADRIWPGRSLGSRRRTPIRWDTAIWTSPRAARKRARAPWWAPWTGPAHVPRPSGPQQPPPGSPRSASAPCALPDPRSSTRGSSITASSAPIGRARSTRFIIALLASVMTMGWTLG
jgi:hypothetical protein